MDDVAFSGPGAVVAADVATIKTNGAPQGMLLNNKKCKTISTSGHITSNDVLAQFIQFSLTSATLLGAPLTNGKAMDDTI